MDRRTFLGTTPAVLAGTTLGASSLAKAEESRGFRRIFEERFEYFYKMGDPPPCCVDHFIVECPYPAGSAQWLSVASHTEGQPVWITTESEVAPITKSRRVVFPRVQEGPNGLEAGLFAVIEGAGDTIEERILRVYEAARANGFDNVKAHETEWKVVWVEFHCSDGRREHIIAGLPASWSSELPLHVMVSTRIV